MKLSNYERIMLFDALPEPYASYFRGPLGKDGEMDTFTFLRLIDRIKGENDKKGENTKNEMEKIITKEAETKIIQEINKVMKYNMK